MWRLFTCSKFNGLSGIHSCFFGVFPAKNRNLDTKIVQKAAKQARNGVLYRRLEIMIGIDFCIMK